MRAQICLLDSNDAVLVNDFPAIVECVATEGDHGFETLDITAELSIYAAARLSAYQGYIRALVLFGGLDAIWDGRIEAKAIRGRNIVMGAVGHWAAMGDLPYTALWSTTDVSVWEPLTEANISTVTSNKYQTDTNNRLCIAPHKGPAFVSGDHGGHHFLVPDSGRRNANVVMFAYEWVAGANWTARLRNFAAGFGSPNTIWTDTPSGYATKTGARFHTFSSSPILAFEMSSNYPAAKTLGTAINDVSTTLAPSALRVNTTSGTAVAAPGTVTITPAAMTNIVNGMRLLYGSNSTNLEKVTVSNVTGTTFDATFKNTHLTGTAIKSMDDWAVPEVDTTLTTGYASGIRTITPTTMANIVNGMSLIIGWGGEAEETVVISTVTATTFACTLLYGHPSGEKIKNGLNTYTVRPNSMTGIIAGMNLDIGGRNAETINVTSVTATTFTAGFRYGHPGNAGVTTSKTQLVTPSSITGILKGHALQIGNNGGVTNSAEEIVEVLSVTGSSFIANFNTPHASTDTVKRVFNADTDVYLKITDLRIATSTVNMIDTTIAIDIGTGAQVVTPASMTGIYVGQKLYIAATGNNGEIVTVTATTSTTFTAVFALSHTASVLVKGISVYADEVVNDAISMHQAVDFPHLSSSTALVESPGYDLVDCWYEDEYPIDFLPTLAEKGDGASPYEIGVRQDKKVYLRPRGALAREWVVDITLDEFQLETARSAIRNSAYGLFRTAEGRVERTAVSTDSESVARLGITRQGVADADTTSETQAERERDNYLTLYANPQPRSVMDFDQLYTLSRAKALLQQLRPGDTVIAGNMPLGLLLQTGGIDPLSWQVLRRIYDLVANKVGIEPRTPVRTAQGVISKGLQLSIAAADNTNKPSVAAKGRRLSRRLSKDSTVI